MEYLFPLLLSAHILVGLSVIGLVLIQHGKGADMGAAFGSGASGSLFGSSGSANFMSRTTGVLAAMFFLTSLSLSYIASSKPRAAVIPPASARCAASWFVSPSARGSENGTPTSRMSTPLASRARQISTEVSKSGSPAQTYATKAARFAARARANAG